MPTQQELLAAIHAHCLECSGGSRVLVERCNVKRCALLPYRSAKAMGAQVTERKIKGQVDCFEVLREARA